LADANVIALLVEVSSTTLAGAVRLPEPQEPPVALLAPTPVMV
jgi:hypothetical protein